LDDAENEGPSEAIPQHSAHNKARGLVDVTGLDMLRTFEIGHSS